MATRRGAFAALLALTLMAALLGAAGCSSFSGKTSGDDAQKFFKDGGAKDPNGG